MAGPYDTPSFEFSMNDEANVNQPDPRPSKSPPLVGSRQIAAGEPTIVVVQQPSSLLLRPVGWLG